jgi:hypothetical protein
MGLVTIALIVVVVWIGLVAFVLAIGEASGRADADEERNLAAGVDDVSNQALAPDSHATVGDDRKSIDRPELEREAKRLGIELPDRPRLLLTRLVGTRRHRS